MFNTAVRDYNAGGGRSDGLQNCCARQRVYVTVDQADEEKEALIKLQAAIDKRNAVIIESSTWGTRQCCLWSCCLLVVAIILQIMCWYWYHQMPGITTLPARYALPGSSNFVKKHRLITLGYPANMDSTLGLTGIWWMNYHNQGKTSHDHLWSFERSKVISGATTFPRVLEVPVDEKEQFVYTDTFVGSFTMLRDAWILDPKDKYHLHFSDKDNAKVVKTASRDALYMQKSKTLGHVWKVHKENPLVNPAAKVEYDLIRIVDELGNPTTSWQFYLNTMRHTKMQSWNTDNRCLRRFAATLRNPFVWFFKPLCELR
jgi:hypothetical protein